MSRYPEPNQPDVNSLELSSLPGEHVVDEELVEACAARIGVICRRKGLETVLEVADEVVKTFFAGDVASARERPHASLQALCRRPDMPSAGTLSRMIGVLAQVPAMEPGLATHPTMSFAHHRLLLPIRDVATKNALARRAIALELGRTDFAELTRAATEAEKEQPGSSTGRRPGPKALPPAVRFVRHLRKAWTGVPRLSSEPLLSEMSVDEQLALAAELEEMGRQLLRTAGHLMSQADALPRRSTLARRALPRRPADDFDA